MCRSSTDPGGPRRCATNARSGYLRTAGAVNRLEHTQTALKAQILYGCAAMEFKMPLPAGAQAALRTARRVGTPLIVGGAVRDAVLGVAPKDIDIEVHGGASIDTLVRCYRLDGFHVDEVGRQFGVLKVSKRGVVDDLDVSVPRRDSKIAAGHRGFSVDLDTDIAPVEAASRRDFTVNALLYDPQLQVLIDPFGGLGDLQSKTLRHVSEQFAEDPLRVLRGAQMAGRFGLTLHPDTAALCRQLRPHFNELAAERTREEWAKLYTKSHHPDLAIRALQDAGWDDALPGLRAALADPDTARAFSSLTTIPAGDRTVIGAAILTTTMSAGDRRLFLNRTVTGTAAARLAEDLAATRHHSLNSPYERRRYAAQMAHRGFTFERYMAYSRIIGDKAGQRRAQAAIADGIGSQPQPPMVQGRDIVAAAGGSRKPGPWVGELVDAALDRQHRGQFRSRTDALQWIAAALSAD